MFSGILLEDDAARRGMSAAARACKFAARQSSKRWPSSPKPVTSVHALASAAASTFAAAPFDTDMDASAPATHGPRARLRISAARIVPVPKGLVSSSASPARMPPLRSSTFGGSTPVTAKPRLASLPSHVWPPASAQPSSRSSAHAPAIIW